MEVAPNFQKAVKTAYRFLIGNDVSCFPVDIPAILDRKGIELCSMQMYSNITGMPLDQLKRPGKNGYTFRAKYGSKKVVFILYNDDDGCSEERKKWTICHETGHIWLKHIKDGSVEEVETNTFAAEVFMPRPVLLDIERRGYTLTLTPGWLRKCFHVSFESATKRLETLQKGLYTSIYHDIVRLLFIDYLNELYPLRQRSQHQLS